MSMFESTVKKKSCRSVLRGPFTFDAINCHYAQQRVHESQPCLLGKMHCWCVSDTTERLTSFNGKFETRRLHPSVLGVVLRLIIFHLSIARVKNLDAHYQHHPDYIQVKEKSVVSRPQVQTGQYRSSNPFSSKCSTSLPRIDVPEATASSRHFFQDPGILFTTLRQYHLNTKPQSGFIRRFKTHSAMLSHPINSVA
jgi:hypothetical protein